MVTAVTEIARLVSRYCDQPMAYTIDQRCNACGLCIAVCPNQAIWPGEIFRINPWLCTECVGFADDPECAKACPVGAIAPFQWERRASSILR